MTVARREIALDIHVQWSSRRVTVTPRGEVDVFTAPVLGGALAALSDTREPDVVLDLGSTTFMDAACLGVIATTAARVRAADGSFTVRSPDRANRRLLALTGLDALVERGGDDEEEEGEGVPFPAAGTGQRSPTTALGSSGEASAPASAMVAEADLRVAHRREVEPLPSALEARTVIAQAQGVIMARHGVSAEVAFAAMCRSSRAAGVPVESRAATILAATRRDGLIGEVIA